MQEDIDKEEAGRKQDIHSIAQFACVAVLTEILIEIAESDGKIDARRLLNRLKAVGETPFSTRFPGSFELVTAFATDMEQHLDK